MTIALDPRAYQGWSVDDHAWKAQGGVHENKRRTWGHSMIVDPWGKVLAQHDVGASVITAEVVKEFIQSSRVQLPALSHSVTQVRRSL